MSTSNAAPTSLARSIALRARWAALVPAAGTRRAVGALGVTQIVSWGTTFYAPTVLSTPITADTGWSKTAVFGADPNWGRFVSAAGYAGVPFEERQLSLWLGETLLYRNGTPVPFDAGAASHYLKNNREVTLRLVFTLGRGRCTFWTCDLTPEYVRLNADYTT